MATISCQCGQVEIIFPSTTKPKTHTECCCNDCRLRLSFPENKGGPAVPSKLALTVKTLDNKMVIVKGKDKLYLYKLTPEAMLINMASTCCQTFLMCRHAVYHGPGTVATAPDVAILENIGEPTTPTARWFTNMHDERQLGGLEKVPHLWVTGEGQIAGNVDNWADIFQAQNAAIQVPVPNDGKSGETFEDVVEYIGKDKIVIVE